MKYRIRYNKTAGQPGRGTVDHKWRVFDETGKEWLCKHVRIIGQSDSEKEPNSEDWNFVVHGRMEIDKENSAIALITEL